MEVPIDVKDIPLPGEDLQSTINTEIDNLTECGDVKDSTDIPGLLEDVQNLVDNTYDAMTDEKTEEQLIEEQAAEAIAECIDVPESKEQNDSLTAEEVAAQCEIITETPDDSFVLTLNASDLEETDKSSENIAGAANKPDDKCSDTTDTENAPTDTVDIPTDTVGVTTDVVDATTDVVDATADVVDATTDVVIDSVDVVNVATDVVNVESDVVNIPTDTVDVATDEVDIPADSVSIPTDTVSTPTDTVSTPTDIVSIPTDTVSKPTDVIKIIIDVIDVANENPPVVSTKIEPMDVTECESVNTTENQSVDETKESPEIVPEKSSNPPIDKSDKTTDDPPMDTSTQPATTENPSVNDQSQSVTITPDVKSTNPSDESVDAESEKQSTHQDATSMKPTTAVKSSTNNKNKKPSTENPSSDTTATTDNPPEKSTNPSKNVKSPSKKSSKDDTFNTTDNPPKTHDVEDKSSDDPQTIKNPEATTIEVMEVEVEETPESGNTVYIIEEISEPIIVDQQDLVTDDQKTTVIEVSSDAVIDSIDAADSEETKKSVDIKIINITEKPNEITEKPDVMKESGIKATISGTTVTKLQLPPQLIRTPILDKKDTSAKTAALKARSIKEEFPNIPCHVLGRNIDNPQEDLVSNGRTPPKPRLGVKVPYRNLTSQIVSRQDIANELIELAAKRNPDPDPPIGGDVFFAKKLTSRLASKIAMKNPIIKKISLPPIPPENINLISSGALGEELKMSTPLAKAPASISDKSDLLAILEGEVEVDLAKELGKKTKESEERPPVLTPENQKTVKKTTISNTPPKLDTPSKLEKSEKKILDPEIERIIALKQLEQFPKRSLRGRYRKQNLQEQVQVRENLIKEIESAVKKEPTAKLADTKSTEPSKAVKQITTAVIQAVKDKKKKTLKTIEKPQIDDDLELRLSYKKGTKTYSRKEPIVVVPPDLAQIVDEGENSQTEAKTLNGETKEDTTRKSTKIVEKKQKKIKVPIEKDINKPEVTLISKRARIIKKKVIWDPDEVPQRLSISPKKSVDEKPKPKKPEESKKDDDKPTEDKKEEKEKEETTVKKKLPKILTKAKVLRLKKTGKLLLPKGVKGRVLRGTNGELKSLKVIKKKKILKKKVKSKMSELDKLLADEGAINMLYNVRSDRKSKKDVISLDKAQRELENRMKAVRDVITMSSTQEDSPKALRRKSPPALAVPVAPPLRKKSRDSLRSSIQSPPPSPSFIYPRAEASRIIRRHSSSFSSECSTPRRMSLDQSQTDKPETKPETTEKSKEPEKTDTTPKRKKGVPIYVRKADEKTYKGKQKTENEPTKEKLSTAEKRKLSNEMSKNFSQSTEVPRKRTRSSLAGSVDSASSPKIPKPTKKVDKFTELTKSNDENQTENEKRVSTRNTYKEISVRRIENLVQLILTPTTTKIKNAINLQMFNELSEMLMKLSKDETCRVVLVSSTDNYFCHGIDFSMLIHANAEKRSSMAQDTAKAVKDFLMTLAQFPKPLVAGVQGPAVGLGVTMLPLFDLVLASDKATFATPYVKLGHVPEGAVLLASPHINGSVLTSELLFACRKLTASEALQHGLVTRVLWPDKFQEELIPIAKAVSKQSSQCMIATKRVLRKSLLANLQNTLEEETKLLVEQWTSNECQQNFKKLLQENEWW